LDLTTPAPGKAPDVDPKKQVDPRMHSAEHILTATLMKLFACGRPFTTHIEKKKSKADYRFHRNLSGDEVARVEQEVNQVVSKDLPIIEEFLTIEEARKTYDLHRLPPVTENRIRIVHVGDYDACPCSGPHAISTAAIGRFRIVSTSFEQDALRVRFRLESTEQRD
jgi:misacylated tRNA(Ala) deacylase